ncbi:hypothetical protein [Marivirga lumbricoides]
MKKYIVIICFLVASYSTKAQEVNSEKMEKDLKVAQTVLKSLVNNNQTNHWNSGKSNNEARYVEGFGVIIPLPANSSYVYNFSPELPSMPDISGVVIRSLEAVENLELFIDGDDDKREENASKKAMSEAERAERVVERAERAVERAERAAEMEVRRAEIQARQKELEARAQTIVGRANFQVLRMDSLNEVNNESKIENIKSFLLEYGHLISQLKDDEKILVMEKADRARFYYGTNGMEDLKRGKLSAEITMKDIRAFQNGKISREEAESRIKINKGDEIKPLAKDLVLMQSIFNRLYQSDLSETYYLESKMPYEQIDGLGVIFYMDVVSSIGTGKDLWKVPTQKKENLSQADRDALIKDMYPKFEAGLKENILEYGQTVSSLANDEQLIFKVSITKCTDCGIPKTLEVQVSGKTLKALKAGSITEKDALNQLTVKKGELQ